MLDQAARLRCGESVPVVVFSAHWQGHHYRMFVLAERALWFHKSWHFVRELSVFGSP